jgi:hypothetical protein
MRRMKKLKNLNWLCDDTVNELINHARKQAKDYHGDYEDMFVEGFLEGINFLRESVEASANKKERAAATDVL